MRKPLSSLRTTFPYFVRDAGLDIARTFNGSVWSSIYVCTADTGPPLVICVAEAKEIKKKEMMEGNT